MAREWRYSSGAATVAHQSGAPEWHFRVLFRGAASAFQPDYSRALWKLLTGFQGLLLAAHDPCRTASLGSGAASAGSHEWTWRPCLSVALPLGKPPTGLVLLISSTAPSLVIFPCSSQLPLASCLSHLILPTFPLQKILYHPKPSGFLCNCASRHFFFLAVIYWRGGFGHCTSQIPLLCLILHWPCRTHLHIPSTTHLFIPPPPRGSTGQWSRLLY